MTKKYTHYPRAIPTPGYSDKFDRYMISVMFCLFCMWNYLLFSGTVVTAFQGEPFPIVMLISAAFAIMTILAVGLAGAAVALIGYALYITLSTPWDLLMDTLRLPEYKVHKEG